LAVVALIAVYASALPAEQPDDLSPAQQFYGGYGYRGFGYGHRGFGFGYRRFGFYG